MTPAYKPPPGSCGTCRFGQSFAEFMGWDADMTAYVEAYTSPEDVSLTCNFPADRLPLSMQGMALAEKAPVRRGDTGCLVHEAKQGREGEQRP